MPSVCRASGDVSCAGVPQSLHNRYSERVEHGSFGAASRSCLVYNDKYAEQKDGYGKWTKHGRYGGSTRYEDTARMVMVGSLVALSMLDRVRMRPTESMTGVAGTVRLADGRHSEYDTWQTLWVQ